MYTKVNPYQSYQLDMHSRDDSTIRRFNDQLETIERQLEQANRAIAILATQNQILKEQLQVLADNDSATVAELERVFPDAPAADHLPSQDKLGPTDLNIDPLNYMFGGVPPAHYADNVAKQYESAAKATSPAHTGIDPEAASESGDSEKDKQTQSKSADTPSHRSDEMDEDKLL
jgi:hypothetical protein